jgi:hypothetical protein
VSHDDDDDVDGLDHNDEEITSDNKSDCTTELKNTAPRT